jgi:hypothetical protein
VQRGRGIRGDRSDDPMTRKWHNEDWRKIYTRLDGAWLSLPWVARGLASDLIRYAKDDGSLCDATTVDEAGAEVARILCARADEVRLIKRGVAVLLADHYLVMDKGRLIVRNHEDAQERRSPDAVRKQRQRDRDAGRDMVRDMSRSESRDIPVAVTGHSSGDETRRDETRKDTHPARVGARSPVDVAWRTAAGTLSADLGDLLRLREHVDACAETAGRDADELFAVAVVEFKALRQTFTNGKIPTLSPRKLLEHWPSVWERITGTAPAGQAPASTPKYDPKRGRAPVGDFTGERSREVKW